MSGSNKQVNTAEGADSVDAEKRPEQTAADAIEQDDPHKVEKLSKLEHAGDEAAEGTE